MKDFTTELLALQGFEGISKRWLLGRNAAISTSSETVWGAGATFARLSANAAFECVSDSASDAAAGVGARTVKALMITLAGVETAVTITLNGTTPVAISGTYVGCNGLSILTTGTTLHNVGNVDVRVDAGDVVHRRLQAGTVAAPVPGLGRDADFVFMIPAGYDGLLKPIRISSYGSTGAMTNTLLQHSSAGVVSVIGCNSLSLQGLGIQKSDSFIDLGYGLKIPELNTIELRSIVSTGVGDMCASAELYLFSRSVGPTYLKTQNGRLI